MKKLVKGPEQMREVAAALLQTLGQAAERKQAAIVGLIGELGAGKTTFAQALAQELGVEEHVTSPTFVIEKIYKLPSSLAGARGKQPFARLVHIDAYRLENGGELETLGWNGLIADPGNLIVVEWADRVQGVLPSHVILLNFMVVDEGTRSIAFANHGQEN